MDRKTPLAYSPLYHLSVKLHHVRTHFTPHMHGCTRTHTRPANRPCRLNRLVKGSGQGPLSQLLLRFGQRRSMVRAKGSRIPMDDRCCGDGDRRTSKYCELYTLFLFLSPFPPIVFILHYDSSCTLCRSEQHILCTHTHAHQKSPYLLSIF